MGPAAALPPDAGVDFPARDAAGLWGAVRTCGRVGGPAPEEERGGGAEGQGGGRSTGGTCDGPGDRTAGRRQKCRSGGWD